MRVRFNKFERVAGLFVLIAVGLAAVGTLSIAVRKGWFSSKHYFVTELPSADGVFPGTVVQMSGLRAGAVDEIELISAAKVRVHFYVFERFRAQVRADTQLQVLRPFIIGDKVLELSVGDPSADPIEDRAMIATVSSFDVMDVFSGKRLGPVLGTLEAISQNLRILGEAFADPKRTESMVKMFDRLEPLLKNLNEMAIEMSRLGRAANKNKRLDTVVENLVGMTTELNDVELGQLVRNLNSLTVELQKLTPAINAIAPELPKTSLRAVEALDETVVLLKALQKSFLLRGSVQEVKEQERKPAEAK